MTPTPSSKKSVDGMIVRSSQSKVPAKKPVPSKPQPAKQSVATKPAAQKIVEPKPQPVNPNRAPLTRWSWGAFLLNWIWGIGNHVWIALLVLIPIAPINLIFAIYLGLKGNELAWRSRQWESPERFIAVQRQWAKWGVVVLILGVVVVLASVALVALLASTTTTTY